MKLSPINCTLKQNSKILIVFGYTHTYTHSKRKNSTRQNKTQYLAANPKISNVQNNAEKYDP